MIKKLKSVTLSSGFATFAMFFGAGNLVFPLVVGRFVEGKILSALAGMLLTTVLIPFTGLVSMTLYKGDYLDFFKRVGKIPGMLMLFLLIGLIGPFGGIPRCVTLTYASISQHLPWLNLTYFTLGAVTLIYLFCCKPSRIIALVGYVLTPLLLLFLSAILIKGLFFSPHAVNLDHFDSSSFFYGLKEGYNTMDLLATFFFASIVYQSIEARLTAAGRSGKIIKTSLKASCIAAGLLTIVYIGFGWLAASHSHLLNDVSSDQLLPSVGYLVMGPIASMVIASAVSMACLTTAIGLAAVCSEFTVVHVFRNKISYKGALAGILLITACCSLLGFTGIVKLLAPVLSICYPSFLALSIVNLLYKIFDFKPVKTPVFGILTLMVVIALM
ncbi:MAG: branched-chain amino acid transport system II carrier protein [Chlamydiia bacterium]|nr:branched-chain amino acid transport system II carrier protein [Chlamydiia bacterium]MCP5491972.1 branched-chain amino acid transport system II carrier protein [Chlamydiales bacterium]